MTIRDLLASASPRIDAEVLLSAALGKDRAWILAHERDDVEADIARGFEEWVKRHNAGEPVAYITGQKEFYGRVFAVRPGVLIPRPCTEALVEAALALLDGKKVAATSDIDSGIARAVHTIGKCDGLTTVVDVGTGSGCIAISIACERPDVRCIAIDSSADALGVASENAKKLGVAKRITFLEGDTLEPIDSVDEPFLIVTNPPYVTDAELLASDVLMHEPREALLGGGKDGGDTLRRIVKQALEHAFCRGIVAECLAQQAGIVTKS